MFGSAACGSMSKNSTNSDAVITPLPSASESELPSDESENQQGRQLSGNSVGNMLNGGKLAQEGEWIYYSNWNDKGSIYRKKIDDSITQKLNDVDSDYLNVCDGWIYYLQSGEEEEVLFKMKIDGSCQQEIFRSTGGDYIDDLSYWDGFLYFCLSNENDDIMSLYRIGKDGTNEQMLLQKRWISNVIVLNDWVYYIANESFPPCPYTEANATDWLYRMRTDGSCNELLFDKNTDYFIVDENWIYSDTFNTGFCKMKKDGSELECIRDDLNVMNMNIYKDWIYFDEYEGIWRMKKDGTDKTLIIDVNGSTIHEFYITEDALLYTYSEGKKYNPREEQVLVLLDESSRFLEKQK